MKTIHITRFDDRKATLGALSIDSRQVLCFTVESVRKCIPAGEYLATRKDNTFILCDVPKRNGIIFKVGNTVADTSGEILLAEEIELDNSIKNSEKAFQKFMERIHEESDIRVVIREEK